MEAKKKPQLGITPDENLELRAEDMTYEDEAEQVKMIHDAMREIDNQRVAKPPASASPRPRKKKAKETDEGLMDFPTAMRAIIDGSTISKKEWDNQNYQARLDGGRLCIKLDDGKWHQWLVSDGDMLGEDWFVV